MSLKSKRPRCCTVLLNTENAVAYTLHDFEVGCSRQPFTSMDRCINPDASASGSRSCHLHTTDHTVKCNGARTIEIKH